MARNASKMAYSVTRGIGALSLSAMSLAVRILTMSAVKNWPARLILSAAMLASGGGGWWWLQGRGDAETNDDPEEQVQSFGSLVSIPQPIPSNSDGSFRPPSPESQNFGAQSPIANRGQFGGSGTTAKASISRDRGASFSSRNSLVSFNEGSSDNSDNTSVSDQDRTESAVVVTDTTAPNSDGGVAGDNEQAQTLEPPPSSYRSSGGNLASAKDDETNERQSAFEQPDRKSDSTKSQKYSAGPPRADVSYEPKSTKSEDGDGDNAALRQPSYRGASSRLSVTRLSDDAAQEDESAQAADGARTEPHLESHAVTRQLGRGTVASDDQTEPTPVGSRRTPPSPTRMNDDRGSAISRPGALRQELETTGQQRVSPTPGDRKLEGAQRPTVTIEKFAPDEVQVGSPAVFEIFVRNEGRVAAQDVTVTDQIPQGTSLVNANPEFEESNGELVWKLGTLEPGKEIKITLELMPEAEGEIGSVAVVEFRSQASVRTVSTKPQLAIQHSGPQKVLIGERVSFGITISNPGTGAATGVVLQEDVPDGLVHPAGGELEYDVGTLRPGESRNLNLELRAEKAGVIENVIRLRGDGNLSAEHRLQLEVVAPSLDVGIKGPIRRYLNRQVAFEMSVANPGTAIAKNVDMTAHLPKGLDFVSADNKGRYDPRSHAVYWSLTELSAGDAATVQLLAMPIEPGEQRVRLEGTGDMDLQVTQEHVIMVEHTTELVFSVNQTEDPIEVGSETVYEIQIKNNGAKPVNNVRMVAESSPELELLRGDGPSKVTIEGTQISAAPISKLAPRQEVVYRLSARGRREGDFILRVQLTSDETPSPVTKEEGTRVYADQ